MLNEESGQGNVAARKSFFERCKSGNADRTAAGNVEMMELGLPPPLPPTPPPRPTGLFGAKLKTGNLQSRAEAPIIRTNRTKRDYLDGPMF